MDQRVVDAVMKPTRVLIRERLDFMRDRNGGGRLTYMAHAKAYVMVRHPHCVPFVMPEKDWRNLPYWDSGK